MPAMFSRQRRDWGIFAHWVQVRIGGANQDVTDYFIRINSFTGLTKVNP